VTPDDLEATVVDHLSQDFFTGTVRAVFDARVFAAELSADRFEPAEAENLRPLFVRAKLNEYLRGVADLLPGCTTNVETTPGSPMKRTVLRGGPVSLTAHAVSRPCGRVKDYLYRQSMAEGNQLSLFQPEMQPTDTLYVTLLHGPYRGRTPEEWRAYRNLPGSVYLAFPTAGLQHYVHKIDLIHRFPDLIDSLLPNTWDGQARIYYKWQASAQSVA